MSLTANAARIIVSQTLLNCGTRAISNWMQRQGQKVSLWQLQQARNMPLVEVWRLAAAFTYALSVGWAEGVLSGSARYFIDYIKSLYR